jgi:hypothetical protein
LIQTSEDSAAPPFSKPIVPEPLRMKLLEVTIGVTTHFDAKLSGLELSRIAKVSSSVGKDFQALSKSIVLIKVKKFLRTESSSQCQGFSQTLINSTVDLFTH